MANIPYKNITSLISNKQEAVTFTVVNNSGLTYTLCDRTDLLSKETNYFSSFRMPYEYGKLKSGSTFSLQNPELQQLNVDQMVIASIPLEDYSEILDGRSITFTVPQISGATMSGKTVVSSTYGELKKSQDSSLLGSNIAFLFCDEINLPRTGTTTGTNTTALPRSTWNEVPFVNRPQAHAYSNLASSDINTDQRPWSGVNTAVNYIPEQYPTTTNQGYNYDIPVGFVSLDKGFMILTHPDIVNNIPWDLGYDLYTNIQNSGTTKAYFNNASVSQVTFNDISIQFKTSVICLALPGEFVFSTNPSWNLTYNIQEYDNQTNGFDAVQVTEIGLYNKLNELIAVAKMDRPVEKTFTNLLTFNLDIDV